MEGKELIEFGRNVLLPLIFGGGGGLVLVYFFGQRLVDHRLTKDLERYREELKESSEVFKSQLSIYAHEQAVSFTRLDTQRSQAIHTIYRCIREVINPITAINAGTPIVDGSARDSADFYLAHAEAAHKACGILANTLADLAIYFDNKTYIKINKFCNASMFAVAIYLQALRPLVARGNSYNEILATAEAGRAQLQKEFETKLASAVQALTLTFRTHLGIERSEH